MKSKVLDRPLFKGDKSGMSEEEASNVGIMDGFMESIMNGEMDDEKPEGEDYETEKLLNRKPDSPEILMNNLRGDMRSIDARVDELADMVGIRAAQDTPQEVLALLQPVLAGQAAPPAMPPEAQGGIGGLPMGMPPAPPAPSIGPDVAPGSAVSTVPPPMGDEAPMLPEAGAPTEMPPEAAGGIGSLPTGQEAPPPVGMARGGYVQHFQEGGDAESFTEGSDRENTGPDYGVYSPELVALAEQEVRKQLAEKPVVPPTLNQAMLSRIPQYKAVLGGSKDLTQAQMLFDLAGGFLNVAAGTDAEGRPIRGAPSSAMRLAAGLRNVPAMVGARAAEYQKSDRDVKMMAMQAGEKDIALAREYNYKLIDGQRKAHIEILKASARSKDAEIKAKAALGKDPFGSGLKGKAYAFLTKNAADYAAGKLTPDEDNRFSSAYAIVSEPNYIVNPQNGTLIALPVKIAPFITNSVTQREKLSKVTNKQGKTVINNPIPVESTTTPVPAADARSPLPVQGTTTSPLDTPYAAPVNAAPKKGGTPVKRTSTIYGSADFVAGPGAFIASNVGENIPGIGGKITKEGAQARKIVATEMTDLITVLQSSPRLAETERQQINESLGMTSVDFFSSPSTFKNRVIGIEEYLQKRLIDAVRSSTANDVDMADRHTYMRIANSIKNFLPKLGVPPRIYTEDELQKLPAGSKFLWPTPNGKGMEEYTKDN